MWILITFLCQYGQRAWERAALPLCWPCYRPLLYHFQWVLIQKVWLHKVKSSGSLTALSLVNLCSRSLGSLSKWTEALLLNHYIKNPSKTPQWITQMVVLSQSTYTWWSFQTSWEASFWLTLCYCHLRWEPEAEQLAACHVVWWWSLTTPDDSGWLQLGKALGPEAVSRSVTEPQSLWSKSSPADSDVFPPHCFAVSFVHGPRLSSLKWLEILWSTLPLPVHVFVHVKAALWWALLAPASRDHQLTAWNNPSPCLGGPVTLFLKSSDLIATGLPWVGIVISLSDGIPLWVEEHQPSDGGEWEGSLQTGKMVCKKDRKRFRKDKCKVQCWGVMSCAGLGWKISDKMVALPGSIWAMWQNCLNLWCSGFERGKQRQIISGFSRSAACWADVVIILKCRAWLTAWVIHCSHGRLPKRCQLTVEGLEEIDANVRHRKHYW